MKNLIFGKYDNQFINTELAPLAIDEQASQYLNNFRIDKYELWFTSNINFIPYNSSPVFVVENNGNTKISGNLLTEKNLTVNGTSTFKNDVTVETNLTVTQNATVNTNLQVRRDVRILNDLYVQGNIISPYLNSIAGAPGEIETLKTDVAQLKADIAQLKTQAVASPEDREVALPPED